MLGFSVLGLDPTGPCSEVVRLVWKEAAWEPGRGGRIIGVENMSEVRHYYRL